MSRPHTRRQAHTMDINEFMETSLELQQKQLDALREIAAAVTQGATVVTNVTTTPTAGKPTKAETPAKVEGSARQASNHAKDDAPAKTGKEKKLTADDVRSALVDLGKREGSDAAIALLTKYKAKSVSEVDEGEYAAIIADAKA